MLLLKGFYMMWKRHCCCSQGFYEQKELLFCLKNYAKSSKSVILRLHCLYLVAKYTFLSFLSLSSVSMSFYTLFAFSLFFSDITSFLFVTFFFFFHLTTLSLLWSSMSNNLEMEFILGIIISYLFH